MSDSQMDLESLGGKESEDKKPTRRRGRRRSRAPPPASPREEGGQSGAREGGGGGAGGANNLLPPLPTKKRSKRDHHRSGSSQSSAAAAQLAVENKEVESRLDERRRQRRQRRQHGSGGGGSQASLRSDGGSSSLFQDPALALAIRELQDDTFSLEQEIAGVGGVGNYPGTTLTPSAANAHAHTSASSAGPSRVPSPVRLSLPVSTLVEKVFTEKPGGGFRSGTSKKKSSIKLSSVNPALKELEDRLLSAEKPGSTPMDVGLETQRGFRSLGVFCHGFLAGLAFWHVVTVSVLSGSSLSDPVDFLSLYSPLAQPLNFVFYLLTVICTVSILDRYDFAMLDWRQVQMMLTLRSGGLAIVVYIVSLTLTLTTTKLDDKISLYQFNSTWFEEIMEPKDLEDDLSSWRSLNLCRSMGVILGWLLVSLRPSTDLLHKHLKKLMTNNSSGKEDKKGEEVPKVMG